MSFVDSSAPGDFTEEEYEEETLLDEQEPYVEDEFDGPVSDEDRAAAMGWKPLPVDPRNPQPHEYRGDPRRWSPAAEFIARGEEELPILREQSRRMSEKLARVEPELTRLRKTVTEQDAAIRHVTALAQRSDKRGYDRAKAELVQQRREAVEAGDIEAHDQVQEQLDALEAGRAEAEAPPPPVVEPDPPPPPAGQPVEITQFVRDHPWFLRDEKLKAAMIAQHNIVIKEEPEWPLQDQLDEALERMTKLYPEVAAEEGQPPVARQPAPPPPAPRRRAPSSLAPGAATPPRRQTGSPFDRIADAKERAEAKTAFASMQRADPGFTEAEYMVIYEDPHADVVELRAKRKK